MNILIVGATGATGRLLTKHLLDRGHSVKAIVRSAEKLTDLVGKHNNLTIVQASVLDLSDAEMVEHVKECDAIASCLGHNLNFKGIYGKPRRLVTDATRRLCEAAISSRPDAKTKFVLMNTTGNRNSDLDEPRTFAESAVTGLIRALLPPHSDNEQAAEYLRSNIGQNNAQIGWAAVRPDTLIDEDTVTEYELHPSPIRSPLFNAGKTSRINCAHFMADLITEDAVWQQWQGQMPVVYNKSSM